MLANIRIKKILACRDSIALLGLTRFTRLSWLLTPVNLVVVLTLLLSVVSLSGCASFTHCRNPLLVDSLVQT